MSVPDPHDQRCNTCGTRHTFQAPLRRCSRCQVTFYCGQDHQTQDFARHHTPCTRIKSARDQTAAQEDRLRAGRGQGELFGYLPPNVFETHVGRFDTEWGTRQYLENNGQFVQALTAANTAASLAIAFEQAMDSVRLSPCDKNYDLWGIPIILLLQGKVQESYDFVKSWPTAGIEGTKGMDHQCLDIRGADLMEPMDESLRKKSACVAPALTFIKVEIASRIQDMIHARMLVEKMALPSSVSSDIEKFLLPTIAGRTLSELMELHRRAMLQAVEAFSFTRGDVWIRILSGNKPTVKRVSAWHQRRFETWFSPLVCLWRRHGWFLRKQLNGA